MVKVFQYYESLLMKTLKFSLVALILSLPTSSIYAEVSAKGIVKNPSIKQDVMSADNTLKPTAKKWRLSAEQWEFARNGEAMMSLPVLKQVVNAWLAEKNKVIEIQYPGGEDGEFWVQELSDWFVALGIPSDHMISVPGSGADDMIQFNLVNSK